MKKRFRIVRLTSDGLPYTHGNLQGFSYAIVPVLWNGNISRNFANWIYK